MNNKLIEIEGCRNIGKTYLINSLNEKIYKYPFANYYNDCYKDENNTNSDKELFYLTISYNLTILDMFKNNIINNTLVTDRGLLSNIVYGIQANRIDKKTAIKNLKYLYNEYKDILNIVYINAEIKKDSRNKDLWEMYNNELTIKLFKEIINECNIKVYNFDNNFDNNSKNNFINLIQNIKNEK